MDKYVPSRFTTPLTLCILTSLHIVKTSHLAAVEETKQPKGTELSSKVNLKNWLFCKIPFPVYELIHKLTLKMLIDMEKMIRHIGFNLDWIDFSDPKFQENSLLYQAFRVWDSCNILCKALMDLKEVEIKIANASCIPRQPDLHDIAEQQKSEGIKEIAPGIIEDMNRITQNGALSTSKSMKIPSKLNSSGDIQIADEVPIHFSPRPTHTNLHRFRFIVWIYKLEEVVVDPSLPADAEFYCTYDMKNLLGKQKLQYPEQQSPPVKNYSTVVKYKLKLDHWIKKKWDFTPVNKMRMFYFFAPAAEGHDQFYGITNPLEITFWCNDKPIAKIGLVLKEVSLNSLFCEKAS